MKRPLVVLVVLAFVLGLASVAFASDVFIGQLVSSGGSINNHTTAVPFALPVNGKWGFICNADSRYRACSANTCAAVNTSTGPDLAIPNGTYFGVTSPTKYVAVIAQSAGAVTCNVYQRTP